MKNQVNPNKFSKPRLILQPVKSQTWAQARAQLQTNLILKDKILKIAIKKIRIKHEKKNEDEIARNK